MFSINYSQSFFRPLAGRLQAISRLFKSKLHVSMSSRYCSQQKTRASEAAAVLIVASVSVPVTVFFDMVLPHFTVVADQAIPDGYLEEFLGLESLIASAATRSRQAALLR